MSSFRPQSRLTASSSFFPSSFPCFSSCFFSLLRCTNPLTRQSQVLFSSTLFISSTTYNVFDIGEERFCIGHRGLQTHLNLRNIPFVELSFAYSFQKKSMRSCLSFESSELLTLSEVWIIAASWAMPSSHSFFTVLPLCSFLSVSSVNSAVLSSLCSPLSIVSAWKISLEILEVERKRGFHFYFPFLAFYLEIIHRGLRLSIFNK